MLDDESRVWLGRIGEHELELNITSMGLIGLRCKRHAKEGSMSSPEGCSGAIGLWLSILSRLVNEKQERFVKDVGTR